MNMDYIEKKFLKTESLKQKKLELLAKKDHLRLTVRPFLIDFNGKMTLECEK